MSSEVILLKRPYISFSSPLLLILRQEITTAAVALCICVIVFVYVCMYKNSKTNEPKREDRIS